MKRRVNVAIKIVVIHIQSYKYVYMNIWFPPILDRGAGPASSTKPNSGGTKYTPFLSTYKLIIQSYPGDQAKNKLSYFDLTISIHIQFRHTSV